MRYSRSSRGMRAVLVATAVLALPSAHAAEPIKLELNAVEPAQGRCRLSFVLENPGDQAIESLKLDLALFNREGSIQHRLLTELGPVRKAKTVVNAFDVESDCTRIGSILLNDVTACQPAALGDCLDRLALSSRVATVRFYK